MIDSIKKLLGILIIIAVTIFATKVVLEFQGQGVQPIIPHAADALPSVLDVQRELNRLDPKLKLQEDGICGPATQAAWDAAVNTQYALALWPKEAK